MLAPNTILQGRYRIIRQLGHGGMGAVYEALNERVSSLVALKETFATTDLQRDAFEREAKLLANLDHEAFPRVMDHFFEDEGQYLVMELVRGNDLWELLQIRETPFPPEKVLEWADQLLDALHELHTKNPPIVHRDIKPANMKLTPRGKIKLLDFGIAKGAAGQMTYQSSAPLSVVGFTPHFAPLEQTLRSDRRWVETFEILNPEAVTEILRSPTDPRSDLYSLGATLYHLMTNQVPSDAATRALAVWSGRTDPLPRADSVNPQVSPAVATVLQRSLALVRHDRPADAEEMRRALREAATTARVSLPDTVISNEGPPAGGLAAADRRNQLASDDRLGHRNLEGNRDGTDRHLHAVEVERTQSARAVAPPLAAALKPTVASDAIPAALPNPSAGAVGAQPRSRAPEKYVGWPGPAAKGAESNNPNRIKVVVAVAATLFLAIMLAWWISSEDSNTNQGSDPQSGSPISTPIVPPGASPASTPIQPPR